jgi:hypothetical protein
VQTLYRRLPRFHLFLMPRFHLFVIAIAFTFVTVMLSGMRAPESGYASPQQPGPSPQESEGTLNIGSLKITNKTAFEIIDLQRLDARNIRITLRNDYGKNITGFQVSVGVGRVQTDLAVGGDNFILPKGTYQGVYAIQHMTNTHGITVLAVVFEDGTTDGDPEAIEEIEYYRLGVKTQRERVLGLLLNALKSDDSDLDSALSRVEDAVSSVPESQVNGLPYRENRRMYNIHFGSSDERMRIVRELQSIMQDYQQVNSQAVNQPSHRQRLLDLVRYYESIISKVRL